MQIHIKDIDYFGRLKPGFGRFTIFGFTFSSIRPKIGRRRTSV